MKNLFAAVICLGAVLLSGCATVTTPDSTTIQGTWKGQEIRNGQAFESWLNLSGPELEFHGAKPAEWYKATYTMKENTKPKQLTCIITESPMPQYAGKTINALYELIPAQDGRLTLILTEYEPGNPQTPMSSQDPHARQIVFTRNVTE